MAERTYIEPHAVSSGALKKSRLGNRPLFDELLAFVQRCYVAA